MSTWFLAYASMSSAIGVVVLVFVAEKADGWMLYGGIFLGVAFLGIGFGVIKYALKLLQREEKRDEDRFQELMKEIRGMRNNLTKEIRKTVKK